MLRLRRQKSHNNEPCNTLNKINNRVYYPETQISYTVHAGATTNFEMIRQYMLRKSFTSVSSTENLISCYEEILNATTSARNKSYENVLTICHAGIEAVPWQLVFLECFAIAVFD